MPVASICASGPALGAPVTALALSHFPRVDWDGLTQLVGLRESNWELRTLTGALFGAAAVWFASPYVDDARGEVLATPQR